MDKWSRYVPPGFGLKRELKFFTAGATCAFVWSLAFFFRLYQARKGLYILEGAEWILSPEAQMPDFVEILDSSLAGFGVVAASAVPWILLHYLYHWQGSRSIYLMRRLPDSWELHRRCLTVPLAAIGSLSGSRRDFVADLFRYLFDGRAKGVSGAGAVAETMADIWNVREGIACCRLVM